jgi:hypothetical protein
LKADICASPGGDINEDRNENQDWITKEAEEAEPRCQDLSQGSRDLRCPGVAEFIARRAWRTRPPSIGKAGIILKRTKKTLTAASLARSETRGSSNALLLWLDK